MTPACLDVPVLELVTRARGVTGSPERATLLARLEAAARAGVTIVQIRERTLDDRALAAFVREAVEAVSGTGTAVVVNDRTDVALAAGASGVHLKSDGPVPADVRRLVGQGFLVGRSVHSVAEAVASSGADYLLFGTVFSSKSKPDGHPATGVQGLADVCRAVAIPVVAIGGITLERAPEVMRAGAAGAAAISYFSEAPDIADATRSLRRALTVSLPPSTLASGP